MGQYFIVVNLDKEEMINPWKFGDGQKLLEFGCSRCSTLTALTILLRQSSEKGGGDISSNNPVVGQWAGDRIAIVGDYDNSKLYDYASEKFEDISFDAFDALLDDDYIRRLYKDDPDFLNELKEDNINLYKKIIK